MRDPPLIFFLFLCKCGITTILYKETGHWGKFKANLTSLRDQGVEQSKVEKGTTCFSAV